MKTRLFIASLLITIIVGGCFLSTAKADEQLNITTSELQDPAPASFEFLAEDGTAILQEYVERCRDTRTGRYAKCPKDGENGGYIVATMVKRCVDSTTKRFVKCPEETTNE